MLSDNPDIQTHESVKSNQAGFRMQAVSCARYAELLEASGYDLLSWTQRPTLLAAAAVALEKLRAELAAERAKNALRDEAVEVLERLSGAINKVRPAAR